MKPSQPEKLSPLQQAEIIHRATELVNLPSAGGGTILWTEWQAAMRDLLEVMRQMRKRKDESPEVVEALGFVSPADEAGRE